MKFCYLDESGTGAEPYPVLLGVVIDAKRARVTRDDWAEIFQVLSDSARRPIREFHAKQFYAGRGVWKGLGGAERAQTISDLLSWFCDRGHHIVYSAVDRAQFDKHHVDHRFSRDVRTVWQFLAFHVVLSIQKHHQAQKAGKGHTVMVFDDQVREKEHFTNLVLDPPSWSDSYYGLNRNKNAPLNQIVDVPHFVDSTHVGLVQVADLMAFIFRRYLELEQGGDGSRYDNEVERVNEWMERIRPRFVPKSVVYPKKGVCAAASYFQDFAPMVLL